MRKLDELYWTGLGKSLIFNVQLMNEDWHTKDRQRSVEEEGIHLTHTRVS